MDVQWRGGRLVRCADLWLENYVFPNGIKVIIIFHIMVCCDTTYLMGGTIHTAN